MLLFWAIFLLSILKRFFGELRVFLRAQRCLDRSAYAGDGVADRLWRGVGNDLIEHAGGLNTSSTLRTLRFGHALAVPLLGFRGQRQRARPVVIAREVAFAGKGF